MKQADPSPNHAEALQAFLQGIQPIEASALEDYLSHWKPFELPKKSIQTQAGQTETWLYFVGSGIQKSYYLHDGKAHVMTFAYAPSFGGVIESFVTQKPSRYTLETITASTFLRISRAHHLEMLQQYHGLETLFRIISERFLDGVIQRQHELLALSMEERFRVFVQRSPHLLRKVSQKDLASYLRIDPTNFSKLINRIKI
ncbi:Crp/Fnr family transcriptional regulator [Pontibacter sp. G13]|uniref:Crp/Fnr family transcriptional regulator n=1 Tax=Pontibacter sp. G13 TaxID=3074898 RepID=UPI0028898957|nr:Crp/Fnr family transcriptional regulator [Pontibacter sp. G13]WNJ17020.1 Crp/Fnr family transcriptional regulator [Pontibacter sp. G13]